MKNIKAKNTECHDIIEDDVFKNLSEAIGFRNSMIHDYMNFNDDVLN
ncbi:MAG: DUF86 domain-containing protein [Deltaproteobacteria bacterium]|nr:DUF86 domain-containing protein [Deltaproteobacteria bacterium]MBT4527044.1 DUF86 domain-containing protein [Deltaproteobacteria bacterium]